MSFSAFVGVVTGIVGIVIGIALTTDSFALLLNVPGLIIVIGGCIAALFLSFPVGEIKRLPRVLIALTNDRAINSKASINEIVEVSKLWLRHDIKKIEDHIDNIDNRFLKTGLQLIIDKCPHEDALDILRWRIARLRAKENAEAQIFRSLAAYAPAFGMVGTLVGLINMMQIIDYNDFSKISLNMAVALLTTFYGLILANLVFRPIATKIERRTEQRVILMSMLTEGISLISQNRSPSFVKETLASFAAQHDDELHLSRQKKDTSGLSLDKMKK